MLSIFVGAFMVMMWGVLPWEDLGIAFRPTMHWWFGELSGILAKRDVAGVTKGDADEYISIILSESDFFSTEKIKEAGDEEIRDFLKILGQKKK